MGTNIYADHAATTQLAPEAFEAMKPFLMNEYGNISQLYSFAREPKKALKEAREIIASCIGALPEELFFTSGGTESDNWAIKGCALSGGREDVIITSSIEHHAILRSCAAVERIGYPVAYLPVDHSGTVLPAKLSEYITDRTRLVSIMLANNEIGTIQPIEELSEIAHQHGAIFHTDATQAVGHIPVNVNKQGIDMLSASAHKFNGPKGIGFLYIRKGIKISPLLDGGSQEQGLRAGTENVPSIVGMAVALKLSCEAMRERAEHLHKLEWLLLQKLTENKLDFRYNGGKNHLPGLLSLSFKGADGEALLHRLDLMGISVSTGSACNSKSTELSHVLRAIDVPEEYAFGTIRVSFGYENTEDDVERIAAALKKIINGK